LVSGEEWKQLFKDAGFESFEERELKFVRTGIYTLA
jgi:hypothetical protein